MNLFIELIQVALGNRDSLSRVPSAVEWGALYEESIRQAVAGIAFEGVKKLPETQRPPQRLLFEWIALSEQIKRQNKYVDKQTATIWKQLKEDGLEAAILKGQGVATLYGVNENDNDNENHNEELGAKSIDLKDNGTLGEYRQSGDIDIWVKGGYQKVCDYVQRTHPTKDVAYHRFHYDFFKDTEVELHHRPTLMRNLFDDRKLAKWYNSFDADSFIYLKDKGFAVPPPEFNRIFILTHIYRHFLFEGIGLRQVMDYYFVLMNMNSERSSEGLNSLSSLNSLSRGNENLGDVRETLKSLRLTRFAEAMMWILHTQLGLDEKYLICGMNEREGRFVLNEIFETGNFGQADKRFKGMSKFRRMTKHGIHLLLHYPSEVIWTPIWLVYHKVWRWRKVIAFGKGGLTSDS